MERRLRKGTLVVGCAFFLLAACAGSESPANDVGPGNPNTQGSHPVTDENFAQLPQGRHLFKIQVSGSALYLTKGSGQDFSNLQAQNFNELKNASITDATHPVQWALMNLDTGRMVAESAGSNRKIFGASVSKVFVAAALVDHQRGELTNSQMQLFANMLVVSSNSAWTELQRQLGDGNADLGRQRIHGFTQRMGYERTRGFQGYWGKLHGNELTAAELVAFLRDTYNDRYQGAEVVWKVLHTVRTGASRGKKYLPREMYVAGKTGTYDGPTVDPENGSSISVRVRNHLLTFQVNGVQYGLAVLADSGTDESAALLAGGFARSL